MKKQKEKIRWTINLRKGKILSAIRVPEKFRGIKADGITITIEPKVLK